jgi:hypothetical protein
MASYAHGKVWLGLIWLELVLLGLWCSIPRVRGILVVAFTMARDPEDPAYWGEYPVDENAVAMVMWLLVFLGFGVLAGAFVYLLQRCLQYALCAPYCRDPHPSEDVFHGLTWLGFVLFGLELYAPRQRFILDFFIARSRNPENPSHWGRHQPLNEAVYELVAWTW